MNISHDRDYIGKYWNRKYIRAVQAILNATKGKIGRGVSFFEKAFGRNEEEYMELLIMPETFLLFRFFFEHLGYTLEWWKAMSELTDEERAELYPIIYKMHTDSQKGQCRCAFYCRPPDLRYSSAKRTHTFRLCPAQQKQIYL